MKWRILHHKQLKEITKYKNGKEYNDLLKNIIT